MTSTNKSVKVTGILSYGNKYEIKKRTSYEELAGSS